LNVGQQEAGRNSSAKAASVWEVLRVSTKLGLTSFGGPVAHLGYFHDEYVRRRKWLDERSYADLVALCQFLPGPASSQVGIGIGIARAGLWGGFAAWAGFTLPSVVALALFAFVLQGYDLANAGWIHGLKIVAAAIVAHAIVGMGQKLTPDRDRVTIAAAAATITLLWPEAYVQVFLILVSGMLGLRLYRGSKETAGHHIRISIRKGVAVGCLALFFVLLVTLPLLRQAADIEWIALFDSFYRSGSLVFGGGHVVLPLLEREVVPTGWVSQEHFLAGYSAAQAVPGPLFTFAGYLGAMSGGMTGVAAATIAIFLPSFLLVVGVLPFWSELRSNPNVQGALVGINAAVVGILLAALYDPLWTTAILSAADFALALLLFIMLVYWRLPPWIVVVVGAIGGVLLEYL
jgi:chromate transporter, chromate ion transporter (CHR) family